MQQKGLRYLPYLLFPLFFAFVSVSNIFDWDHFLAGTEVDLRSWMIWHEAPVWSYQLCGGVTRIGDPQAFGLSPFFLFNVLFGSVWGWKIFLVSSAAAAVFFLERIRKEFFSETPEGPARIIIYAYVFGNSFLWHFHHGHLTFILHYWVVALCYYYLRAVSARFSRNDFLAATAIVFCIFSAGFYHTSVFFGLPLGIACAAHLLIGLKKRVLKPKPLLLFFSAFLLGIALSAYKWLGVLQYQMTNPRTVSSVEVTSLLDFVENLLLPTVRYKFLGFFDNSGPWMIWEYSVFSLATWIFLLAILFAPKKMFSKMKSPKYTALFPMIFALVSLVFYVGGDSTYYPFYALNHYLFHDSVRVVGRFGHNLVFAFTLLSLGFLPSTNAKFFRFLKRPATQIAAIVLIAANFFSFSPSLYVPLLPTWLTSLPTNVEPKMRSVFVTRLRDLHQSFMFEPVAAGQAVLNCYNPIARGVYATGEMNDFVAQSQGKSFPFVEFQKKPSEDCLQKTYFTANHIRLGLDCPKACFSLNDLSEEDRRHFDFDEKKKVYCSR